MEKQIHLVNFATYAEKHSLHRNTVSNLVADGNLTLYVFEREGKKPLRLLNLLEIPPKKTLIRSK